MVKFTGKTLEGDYFHTTDTAVFNHLDYHVNYFHIVPVFFQTFDMIFLFGAQFAVWRLKFNYERFATGHPENSVRPSGVTSHINFQAPNSKVSKDEVACLQLDFGFQFHQYLHCPPPLAALFLR